MASIPLHTDLRTDDPDMLILGLAQLNMRHKEETLALQRRLDKQEAKKAPIRIASGKKRDVLKVLAAMAAAGLLTDAEGAPITQKQLMEVMGELMGEDFSNAAQALSNAKQQAKADGEGFLRIFDRLKQWGEEYLEK